ncbi:NUDIX hydrolase [Candidatus Woesearchaeota archaeon]|nr:NUDIX hydrolase [Candidatus Woesearchaeota archaeon]
MENKTKTIVCGVLVIDNEVLLIKRVKPPYMGYWAMVGGKLEFGEHVEEAAVREFYEETGIKTEFESIAGIASEIVYSKNEKTGHFLIFVCRVKSGNKNFIETEEGNLKWFDLNNLDKEKIVPSDILMIQEFILKNKRVNVHKIKMVEDGDKYSVEEFTA